MEHHIHVTRNRVRRWLQLALSVGLALLALAVLLFALSGATTVRADPGMPAVAGAMFAATAGSGTGCTQAQPCSLQTALAQAEATPREPAAGQQ